jgi:hypothetical protein
VGNSVSGRRLFDMSHLLSMRHFSKARSFAASGGRWAVGCRRCALPASQSIAPGACCARQRSRSFHGLVLGDSTRQQPVAARSPPVPNPEFEHVALESDSCAWLIRDLRCTSATAITPLAAGQMHAFPTKIPGCRACRRPAILCEMISWLMLATMASASMSHATLSCRAA